jgi:hypothetical protein
VLDELFEGDRHPSGPESCRWSCELRRDNRDAVISLRYGAILAETFPESTKYAGARCTLEYYYHKVSSGEQGHQ